MGHVDIASLIVNWQTTGADTVFAELFAAVRGIVEQAARRELHRHRIDDPMAVDDAVSLVFDHLRRLPPHAPPDRPVSPFLPRDDRGAADAGLAYVIWLAIERARDVARAARTRSHRATTFSQLDDTARHSLTQRAALTPSADRLLTDDDADADRAAMLAAGLARLDPPLARVLTMLLEGKSQAAIAAELHVCEGTVSRMRSRAIGQLRHALRPP